MDRMFMVICSGGGATDPVPPIRASRTALAALTVLVLGLLAGCTDIHQSPDFERHRHSQLFQPYDKPDRIYFDVRFSTDYPADDPAAEGVRQQWLTAWLRQRGLCPGGHEAGPGRPFDYLEDNPARYDRRYEVRCLPPPQPPGQAAAGP